MAEKCNRARPEASWQARRLPGEKHFARRPRAAQFPAMTEEQAHAAIAEAERAGFDLSLVDCSLAVTPEERCLQHAAALEFALECLAAGEKLYARPAPAAAAAR
jgi:hypothetical protein